MTKINISTRNSFVSESELVDILVLFLVDQGYKVKLEVSNMGQSVDVVANKKSWYMLVEAKINNWKRAIEQCQAHRMVGDHICIAIGTKVVSTELLKQAKIDGIGLIHCSASEGSCTWVEAPQKNTDYWHPERERFIEGMKEISYAG